MVKIRESCGLYQIIFYMKQICKKKTNRCLAVLPPPWLLMLPQCHLMLPNGGPGARCQHCSPAQSVKRGLRPRRATGEGTELPLMLLGSECGLRCSLLIFLPFMRPSQLQMPHRKCLHLQEACSEKNTDPSCLAPDFRLPARVSLTFPTHLLAGILKNNSYNPAGLAAAVLWKIWSNDSLIC